MLVALLRVNHPLTLNYLQGLTYVQQRQDTFGKAFADESLVGPRLAPALLVEGSEVGWWNNGDKIDLYHPSVSPRAVNTSSTLLR